MKARSRRILTFRRASPDSKTTRTPNHETSFTAADNDVHGRVLLFAAPPHLSDMWLRGRYVPAEAAGWFNESFWPAYPKKAGEDDAFDVLLRMRPTQGERDHMLAFLEIAKTSPQWRNRRNIPRPAAWLMRWLNVDRFGTSD